MVEEATIHDYVGFLDKSLDHNEKIIRITKGMIDLFPFNEVHLFRYSPLGYVVEGIVKVNKDGVFYIGHMRDDIRNLPPIYNAIKKRKSIFISQCEFFEKYGCAYTNPNEKNEHLIVPINSNMNVIGYFVARECNKNFVCTEELLSTTTLYGKLVGKVIESNIEGQSISCLSKRETEVIQRISWGESIKEMSVSMGISEFTVKDYIKSVIKKLEVNNRVEAVAELLRRGLIS
ncbi:regulatory protein, luxR family [Alteribacillus persepolensis]|uniref:Regulatory protein, luxR family n=1 Tax=Alteribacillus persepolensis TaxID=568899 RepID=A0A1G8HSD4_9BACI|nr:LuxR C-terminal-related transcriptional regulator [Alteribacillus persepolensis]SDI09410.1 regulatory protein, luxR family [Alteribacillus persepolensis]